ncbi:15304_t:CDS:1, partial [Racocetra fulgida]
NKYKELSYNLCISPLTPEVSINLINQNKENDTFTNMWASGQKIIQVEKDEVSQYINLPEALENDNPLAWWNDYKKTFSILSSLACDYFGVSAISVLSERLFSDTGAYISAR